MFVACWMDDHIGPRGWDRMSSVDSATKVRYWFEPANARFFEYRSTGPGAVASPTRRVLGEGDARSYTVVRVLGSGTSADDIALAALGKESTRPTNVESLSSVSYADWRVELLGLVSVES